MKQNFKIGDLVYVEGFGAPKKGAPRTLDHDIDLALILKIHTKANPKEVFYKLHLMEKNKEEWISGAYLQPTH